VIEFTADIFVVGDALCIVVVEDSANYSSVAIHMVVLGTVVPTAAVVLAAVVIVDVAKNVHSPFSNCSLHFHSALC
jgi:hypothetical protein